MWALQVAIENWNKTCIEEKSMIRKVLLTGLGTGCGRVGAKKCASQMVLAVQHFHQPVLERPRWGGRIYVREKQVAETVNLGG
jgi:O-acetyl-ADP-ribose deacetylase (regulator of RNase III)